MLHTLWSEHISIHDDFLDAELLEKIRQECRQQIDTISPAGKVYSLISQDIEDTSTAIMGQLHPLVTAAVTAHCASINIDFENLEFNDCQLGFLRKFNEQVSLDAFHEPHHDMVENVFVNTILYVDSEYGKTKEWVGGELILYKDLSCGQFPRNTVRIRPLENRLIVFSAYNIHRVNPYFGDIPRTAIINCWGVGDLKDYDHTIL